MSGESKENCSRRQITFRPDAGASSRLVNRKECFDSIEETEASNPHLCGEGRPIDYCVASWEATAKEFCAYRRRSVCA